MLEEGGYELDAGLPNLLK